MAYARADATGPSTTRNNRPNLIKETFDTNKSQASRGAEVVNTDMIAPHGATGGAARPSQCAAGNGVAQKGLLILAIGIANQPHVTRRHTISDAAKIFLIFWAENTTPRHGKPKPGRNWARRQARFPKRCTRWSRGFHHMHVR